MNNATSTTDIIGTSKQPSTANSTTMQKLKFVEDESTGTITSKNKEEEVGSFYPKVGMYEAGLMKEIIEVYKQPSEHLIWDPRGWKMPSLFGNDPKEDKMPPSFCPYCCCPPNNCHVQLFGQICHLHVVNTLYNCNNHMMTQGEAEKFFVGKYNIGLEFMVVKEAGQLDVKIDGYPLPKCVRKESLPVLLDYVQWYTYHCKMHSGIVASDCGRNIYAQPFF
jgi:hypothetical protein